MTFVQAKGGIDRRVVYRPRRNVAEEGVITGVSGAGWAFVRYDGDDHAKATDPAMLEFLAVTG